MTATRQEKLLAAVEAWSAVPSHSDSERDSADAGLVRALDDYHAAPADQLDALLAEVREKIAQPDACEKGPGAALSRAKALADDAGRSRTTRPRLARGEALDAMAWLAIGILALDRETGR